MTDPIKGLVYRIAANAGRMNEGVEKTVRMGDRGELMVMSTMGGLHMAGQEGTYFSAQNATIGTGIAAGGVTQTAWVATTPSLTLFNNNEVGGKSIIMDSIELINTVAGASLTDYQFAVFLDSIDRYSSGGTALAIKGHNMELAGTSNALVYFGAITAVAASANVRKIGRGYFHTAIPVINDQYVIRFGGNMGENMANLAATTASIIVMPCGPAVIGPQQSLLVYLWGTAMATTSPAFEVVCGFMER